MIFDISIGRKSKALEFRTYAPHTCAGYYVARMVYALDALCASPNTHIRLAIVISHADDANDTWESNKNTYTHT